jgi:ATP-dependent Zn protease
MKILAYIIAVALNIILIDSYSILCDSPINLNTILKNRLKKEPQNEEEDSIDIEIPKFMKKIEGTRLTAGFKINQSANYVYQNIKSLDFQLMYTENEEEKYQLCKFVLPEKIGDSLRILKNNTSTYFLKFSGLKYLTDYKIQVGYTHKNGKSFSNKANETFTTCFGEPSNLLI